MRDYINNQYSCDQKKDSNKKVILNLSLILIISVLLFAFVTRGAISTGNIKMKNIEVSPGDSLWVIAKKHYSPQIDIRKRIYQIKRINNLTSANLQPGQTLKIPKK